MNAPYVSPYGKLEGLPDRLAKLSARLRNDRSFPWLGTGIIEDLELMRKFAGLREYGEFLRERGGSEVGPMGDQILDACDLNEEAEKLEAHIDESLGVAVGSSYEDAITAAQGTAESLAAIRETLVEAGALEADDTETDLAMLVGVLLA